MNQKKIIAISGSTRQHSTNSNLILAISELTKETLELQVFEGLSEIPHFNPDLDNETPPRQVTEFRNKLNDADGILICTPEYAMGVPGTLKNAIDWTVSSCEFSQKPTALITASSVGNKGHASLIETLQVIEALITEDIQLIIPFAKTKISKEGKIIDLNTQISVEKLMQSFYSLLVNKNKRML